MYLFAGELLGTECSATSLGKLPTAHYYTWLNEMRCDPVRNSFAVQMNATNTMSMEEVTGMVLANGRVIAEAYTGTKDKDVVITVPPFYTMEQREALLEAAKLANFNVLSLINSGTAVALHYAFGRKFEETPQYVAFYDMGHTSTKVSIVEFRAVPAKSGKKNSTVPQLKVLSVGWDKDLGGRTFTRRLAERMADEAMSQMKAKGLTPVDIRGNVRAMARMVAASEKAKLVLSANQETSIYVESLIDESFDFRATVTREQFESWCSDLLERVAAPLNTAIDASGIAAKEITAVEIVGGGVRVPKVQAVLREAAGVEELSKHLNGDEAAVLGAVFFAAQSSTTMRVPDYRVKDMTTVPVRATLVLPTTESTDEELVGTTENDAADSANEEELVDTKEKETKRMLVKFGDRLGTRKHLAFRSANPSDFTVELSYADGPKDGQGISFFTFSGLDKAQKYNYTGKPKVVLGFKLTTSGLVELERADAEITVITYPQPEPEVNITIDADASTTAENNADGETADSANSSSDGKEATEQKKEANEDQKEESKDKKPAASKDKKEDKKKPKAPAAPKKYTHRVALDVTAKKLNGVKYSQQNIDKARQTLAYWDNLDFVKKDTAESKNDLETFIYATKDKLYDLKDLAKVTTEAQREELTEALTEAGDWLDDEGYDTTAAVYRAKLKSLRKLSDPVFYRVAELERRPKAVTALRALLNRTSTVGINITKAFMIEEDEYLDFERHCNDTQQWLDTAEKQHQQQADNTSDEPVLRSEEIMRRLQGLEKKLQNFLRRRPRPLPTPSPSVRPSKKKPAAADPQSDDTSIPTTDSDNSDNNDNSDTTTNNNNYNDNTPAGDDDTTATADQSTLEEELHTIHT
eukprot:TRINITY_DN2246_c0_g1_i3.p1 TRINITY_DN2246_c0_g1~~TRINITY_DN2246_c0_g1_i3.p1  ORF type:complete len:996 (-),score=275.07 TRINITY_DN2246_c0_g1_i3:47-2653(-)